MEGVKEADYSMSVGPEQLMNSLWTHDSSTIYEIMTSGKSGALFYFTKDRNYMLKSIAHREFNKLFSILNVYL
jgi:1-phosphatidylinositol-4-phosphate 5-kinase